MYATDEGVASPLLGDTALDTIHDRGLDERDTSAGNEILGDDARCRFKDMEENDGEQEEVTAYIWMLVGCASISGLMFGEQALHTRENAT